MTKWKIQSAKYNDSKEFKAWISATKMKTECINTKQGCSSHSFIRNIILLQWTEVQFPECTWKFTTVTPVTRDPTPSSGFQQTFLTRHANTYMQEKPQTHKIKILRDNSQSSKIVCNNQDLI